MKNCWLFNKTVILSGASGGIGRELAKQLIKDYGCHVIGTGRSEQKMLSLSASLGDYSGNFEYYLFDASDADSWRSFAKTLDKKHIKPDILINNCGIMPNFAAFSPCEYGGDISYDVIRVSDTNYHSAVYAISELMPMLKKSDTPAIINVSSAAALAALPGTSAYSASKAALKSFTECLAVEQRGNIYVGLICPGFAKSDIFREQRHFDQNKLIDFFSMDSDKMAKKIIRSIKHHKTKAVIGLDAKSMDIMYRLFGCASLRLFYRVMKASKLELFDDIFNSERKIQQKDVR